MNGGHSLRDDLAIAALPAMLARELGSAGSYQHPCPDALALVAKHAYAMADAMLAERVK